MAIARAQEFSGPDLELDEYYDVKISKAEDGGENRFQPGVPRVVLTLQILDPNTHKPQRDEFDQVTEFQDWISVKPAAGRRSRLYQYWSARFHGGAAVPDGEEMNTDDLPGGAVRILWGMVQNSFDHTERPGIIKVAPVKWDKKRQTVTDEDVESI